MLIFSMIYYYKQFPVFVKRRFKIKSEKSKNKKSNEGNPVPKSEESPLKQKVFFIGNCQGAERTIAMRNNTARFI